MLPCHFVDTFFLFKFNDTKNNSNFLWLMCVKERKCRRKETA